MREVTSRSFSSRLSAFESMGKRVAPMAVRCREVKSVRSASAEDDSQRTLGNLANLVEEVLAVSEDDEGVLAELLLLPSGRISSDRGGNGESRIVNLGVLWRRIEDQRPEREVVCESSRAEDSRSCRGCREGRARGHARKWPYERGRWYRRRICSAKKQGQLAAPHSNHALALTRARNLHRIHSLQHRRRPRRRPRGER